MTPLEFCQHMNAEYFPPYPWAMDFCRAMADRPLWARLLFRIVAGKYAYREFIGLKNAFIGLRHDMTSMFAVVHSCEYYSDSVPFKWWEDWPYQPKKGESLEPH